MVKSAKDFVGPPTWLTLHSLAAAYSSDQKDDFIHYVRAMSRLFPCKTCRDNFKLKLEIVPVELYLNDNHSAFLWTYIVHDMVNVAITRTDPKNAKTSPPYNDVKFLYFSKLGEKCEDCEIDV